MVIPFTDLDGAARQREVIARMREQEAGAAAQPPVLKGEMGVALAEKKKQGSKWERHQYLEEHKAEIIADYKVLGRKGLIEKWGLSETGWDSLIRKRWAPDVKRVIADSKEKGRRQLLKKYCPMLTGRPDCPAVSVHHRKRKPNIVH